MDNLILATDSYKLNHWKQYPHDTEAVYSYFESRAGAAYPYTVFFGLQYILEKYLTTRITYEDLSEALAVANSHFGQPGLFNYQGWAHIIEDHNGLLPLKIKAVPEGTCVPTGNVLMTVENTCDKCFWLTNAMESLLTHVWYPSTVATLSRTVKQTMDRYLSHTSDSKEGLPFMLHDFGYRGASSHETAAIGGAGHLVNFMGTDTLPAMLLAMKHYSADLGTLAFSVPATEHSVMTALGKDGEMKVVDQLLEDYPTGILSVVSDSYNYHKFVDTMCIDYKEKILARDGVFVFRPDSVTRSCPTPEKLVQWTLETLAQHFDVTYNDKGFAVLDSHVRVIWGDGIDPHGIEKILARAQLAGFSAENLVFGMGGGLLQKVNRDTQRFAFKCSAQKRSGQWHDVQKSPLDQSKKSKAGRLRLLQDANNNFATTTWGEGDDILETVFENGKVVKKYTFDEIRQNAAF